MLQSHIKKKKNLIFKSKILKLVDEFVTNKDRSLIYSTELTSNEWGNTMF